MAGRKPKPTAVKKLEPWGRGQCHLDSINLDNSILL